MFTLSLAMILTTNNVMALTTSDLISMTHGIIFARNDCVYCQELKHLTTGERLSVDHTEVKEESGSMTGGSVLMDLITIPSVLLSKSISEQGRGLI